MPSLMVIEQQGQRVLTTEQLAAEFETDVDRIQVNFNRNKSRFIPGKHFFLLEGESLRAFKAAYQIDNQLKYARSIYLWTEKGAWMIAKTLNTDRAWDGYSRLVDDYYERAYEDSNVVPLDQRKVRMELLKTALDHEERLDTVEGRLNDIERKVDEQITLGSGEQRALQKAIARRVYDVEPNEMHRQEMFRQLHREIKDRWGVPSYKDVRRSELGEVLRYVDAWRPRIA